MNRPLVFGGMAVLGAAAAVGLFLFFEMEPPPEPPANRTAPLVTESNPAPADSEATAPIVLGTDGDAPSAESPDTPVDVGDSVATGQADTGPVAEAESSGPDGVADAAGTAVEAIVDAVTGDASGGTPVSEAVGDVVREAVDAVEDVISQGAEAGAEVVRKLVPNALPGSSETGVEGTAPVVEAVPDAGAVGDTVAETVTGAVEALVVPESEAGASVDVEAPSITQGVVEDSVAVGQVEAGDVATGDVVTGAVEALVAPDTGAEVSAEAETPTIVQDVVDALAPSNSPDGGDGAVQDVVTQLAENPIADNPVAEKLGVESAEVEGPAIDAVPEPVSPEAQIAAIPQIDVAPVEIPAPVIGDVDPPAEPEGDAIEAVVVPEAGAGGADSDATGPVEVQAVAGAGVVAESVPESVVEAVPAREPVVSSVDTQVAAVPETPEPTGDLVIVPPGEAPQLPAMDPEATPEVADAPAPVVTDAPAQVARVAPDPAPAVVAPAPALPEAVVPEVVAPEVAAPAPEEAPRDGEIPTFDVVRVDRSGQAVIAGRAEPGCQVEVRDGDALIGEVESDRRGEWVVVTSRPLDSGSRELGLTALCEGAQPAQSDRLVVVVVPRPGADIAGRATEQDSGALALSVPREGSGQTTVLQAPVAQEVARADDVPMAEDQAAESPLSLDVIDYNDAGRLVLSGRADGDANLQVYLDNDLIGRTQAAPEGDWTLAPQSDVAPGLYDLRVDEVRPDGSVVARIELPFLRGEPLTDLPDGRIVVVQPGNSLWRLARRTYGAGIQYTLIFDANRDQIRNEDLIYPGQVFMLPEGLVP